MRISSARGFCGIQVNLCGNIDSGTHVTCILQVAHLNELLVYEELDSSQKHGCPIGIPISCW